MVSSQPSQRKRSLKNENSFWRHCQDSICSKTLIHILIKSHLLTFIFTASLQLKKRDKLNLMGVFKLWQLLLTIAQPQTIQNLSGKVLAIDVSIWIVRLDTGLSSNSQKIKSILNKIMLLKRYDILPVFVFDGLPPALKRKTLEERYRKRIVADDQQAKKRSEIQIMRMIQGGASNSTSQRMSEKSKRIQANECQLEVINEQLKKISEIPKILQQQISSQLLQKITLQSQILNTKYNIMLQLLPQYSKYPYFLTPEEYAQLDIDLKLQYLDQLEQFKWKHLKKEKRKEKRLNLSQEDKLRHDLDIIEKKSIVREMQDNLFRKMMQKHVKIQNGYQIIETIYNGKPVIQKRKIKEKGQQYGLGPLKKDKMKNNFGNISFGQEKESNSQVEEDPFIASLCNHSNITSQTTSSNVQTGSSKTQKFQNFSNKQTLQKHRKQQTKPKPSKKPQSNAQNNPSRSNYDTSQPYIPFRNANRPKQQQPQAYVNAAQLNTKIQAQSQSQSLNRDHLPNFNSEQHPSYLNSSNDNVQLQNLFTILGLPFLVAPGEAEAQCAALELEGIVDGIVTEDSDVFLFGGKNVYRGVFGNNSIRYYSWNKMQQKLKLTREKLIIFAELLGSDYTEGVKGVGLVNAMEILKVFDTFDKLQKFKTWAQKPDVLLPEQQTTSEVSKFANEEQKQFYELHKKFKNYWYVNPSFGDKVIHNAYLHPDTVKREHLKTMKQKGAFQQKPCKEELLSKLLKERLQMQEKEYHHYMKLLTLKVKNRRPNTLFNYFRPKDEEEDKEIELAKIRSKRLQKSIGSLSLDKK